MTSEKFERMSGLVSLVAIDKFECLIRSIRLQLAQDGFDDVDIQEFLEITVEYVMRDITDPL